MLEDVVPSKMVERKPRSVRLRVCGYGKVEQKLREALVDIYGVGESIFQILLGDVLARARQEPVIRERVQERTGTSD